jgi:predicted permease
VWAGLRETAARLAGTWRPGRADDDLEAELRAHAEFEADAAGRRGSDRTPPTAFPTARAMDALRDQRRLLWIADLDHDLRDGIRALRRAPFFSAMAVLTLAVGIGAATAVFSVLDAVVLEPLAYPQSERLVGVWMIAPGAPGVADVSGDLRLSTSTYFTFADETRTFEHFGIWYDTTATVTGLGDPEEVRAVVVSDGVLQALGVPPLLGRWLTADDQVPNGAASVVLGYGYWQREFGGARDVIGREVRIDEVSRHVVGVLPTGFTVLDKTPDVVLPAAFDRRRARLAGFGYLGIARLKAGATIAEADADITRMLPLWMARWPAAPGVDPKVYENWRIGPALRLLKNDVVGTSGRVLWILMGTVGLLLLTAIANVGNLVLVRAEGRQRELAIRAAIGAGRARILRGLLVEQLILGLSGGILGLAMAYGAIRVLVAVHPPHLPRLMEIGIDARTISFALAMSVVAALGFCALAAARAVGSALARALSATGRANTESRDRRRIRDLLVVTQVALVFVLLVASGLLVRTFRAMAAVDPGFADAAHVETLRVSIPRKLEANPVRIIAMQRDMLEKIRAIPGVTAAAFASGLPLDGQAPDWDDLMPEGRIYRPGEVPSFRVFKFISPGYCEASGTPLAAGREYDWTDVIERRRVAMISANLAREFWGSPAAAIGKRVRTLDTSPWREVIGVVADTHDNGVDQTPPATAYWPAFGESLYDTTADSSTPSATFTVRSERAGSGSLQDELRRAVWSVNRSLPVAGVRTLDEIYVASLARTSFAMTLLTVTAMVGLGLGLVGIYGLVSYGVSQRWREIGIRLALGAAGGSVRGLFIRRALVLTAAGAGLGLGFSMALTGLMTGLLFKTSPLDPLTYGTVPAVLLATAIVASYIPARRAAGVDPVTALRGD